MAQSLIPVDEEDCLYSELPEFAQDAAFSEECAFFGSCFKVSPETVAPKDQGSGLSCAKLMGGAGNRLMQFAKKLTANPSKHINMPPARIPKPPSPTSSETFAEKVPNSCNALCSLDLLNVATTPEGSYAQAIVVTGAGRCVLGGELDC